MKILQLNLLAFGHFTDTHIDLSNGGEGFHIIYGPNEAGKSSALRALQQMLYGIHTRTLDNFLHHHSKMRIGGVLRHSDGSELKFIRRKGRVNTILAVDTGKVLEESLLETFLGGVDADTFTTMFGIDHSKLVKGGEKILEGGGNIGQALFAAGSGITDLRKVQNDLRGKAEELFTRNDMRTIYSMIKNFCPDIVDDIKDADRSYAAAISLQNLRRNSLKRHDKNIDAKYSAIYSIFEKQIMQIMKNAELFRVIGVYKINISCEVEPHRIFENYKDFIETDK